MQRFLDTNVLIYAASMNPRDANKKSLALALMAQEPLGTSGQVLAEFYVNFTRKGSPPMTYDEARVWVDLIDQQPCVPVDGPLVQRGIAISQAHQVSYWDGAIIAAAEVLGAATLFTEDLSHGQVYGKIRVQNPFLIAP